MPALDRVQVTPKANGSVPSITLTFSSPPTIGNSIIITVISYSGTMVGVAATDNRGNAYQYVIHSESSTMTCAILYCPIITATGTPFTITVTKAAGSNFLGAATEFVGEILKDKTATNTGSSTAISTGTTAALTADSEILAAVQTIGNTQGSIAVVSATPVWTEEWEHLSFAQLPGEGDTRVVTGALGSTQSCSWTGTTSAVWAGCIATFKAVVAASASESIQFSVVRPD